MSKQSSRAIKAMDESFKRDVDNVIHGQRDHLSHVAQKYYDAIIDAEHAKACGIPTAVNYAGKTGCFKTKAAGEFKCGNTGLGYIAIFSPTQGGPYTDRVCAAVTDGSAFLGSTIDVNAATAGVSMVNWSNAPFTSAGSVAANLAYRLVGIKIKVKPVSSATVQDGRLTLVEDPNHEDLAGRSFSNLNGYTYSRGLSAVDLFGASKNEIVLNMHPKGREANASATSYIGPFQWTSWTAATTNGTNTPMVIAADCAVNVAFSYEIYAIWETRGRSAKNLRETIPDSRGIDLVFAACARKSISGWVGQPREVSHSYYSAIWHAASKMGDPILKALKKEFLTKDKGKTASVIKELMSIAGFAA